MSDVDHSIAIVGMALRFPGANSPAEFWQNLIEGRDCSRLLSKEELIEIGVSREKLEDPAYVFRSYDVDNMEMFDAKFFGMSPREARLSDPQLRFIMETTYECIEDSGHDLLGKNVGLYVGATDNKYWLYYKLFQSCLEDDGEIAKRIFTLKDYFATQTSHRLGLTGPSISMNSACSTALLATHEACNHLLMYDCDYALAGGCEILKGVGYRYQEGGLSSKDGYVRAFDADASGTIFGSGIGVVLLRRLTDALEDNDHIYAVIRSTAVNNDGDQKVGYMAPGIKGQMGVIHGALARAGVDARDVSYVETHGTGTNVGDPIEIESLTRVYRRYTSDNQYCAIGSVKTNVGHLSIAAGIAGLIKTALMLKHKKIPASLNFSRPNPAIDFPSSPFYVNTELKDWDVGDHRRIAGVSAFGVGGTNTHAILEEAPERPVPAQVDDKARLILLSAKNEAALNDTRARMATYLERHPDTLLADLSYTLNTGRPRHDYRCYEVVADIEGAREKLRGEASAISKRFDAENLSLAFMFPGQGSQYPNMGRALYEKGRVYGDSVKLCAQILKDLGIDIVELLYPEAGAEAEAAQKLDRTEYTQLALFVTSYALARQYIHWGLTPSAMIGHSVGEYVAACLAGVFDLADGLKLVAQRGKLMQSMPPGSMLSVPLGRAEVEARLGGDVSVAGVNSPSSTVVSGTTEAIKALQEKLLEDGVKSKILRTSHGFHSVMMDPILEPFRAAVADVELQAPTIPFVSNVTGTWITEAEATDPDYWVRQLRQAVLFADGVEALVQSGPTVLLEVGPGAALSSLAGQQDLGSEVLVLRSMRRPNEEGDDVDYLLRAAGSLWCAGVELQWQRFYEAAHGLRIALPTYPFQRERYWIEKDEIEELRTVVAADQPLEHPLLGRRIVSSAKVVAFENEIDRKTPPYIADHRLVETAIFPGAGFTQMALEVGRFFVKNKKIKLDEIRFAKALMLPEGVRKTVQIIATARDPYGCTFEIISRTVGKTAKAGDDGWVLHAKGVLSAHSQLPEHFPMPALIEKEGSELVPLDLYYDALKFITFGPSFRAVRRMWIGDNESLGWVELPDHLKPGANAYSFHPVLLDAAFQVIDGPRISESGTLPVGLKNLTLYDEVPERFYVAARRFEGEEEFSIGDITVFSDNGATIATIEHYLQKEIADSDEFGDPLAGVVYDLDWISLPQSNEPLAVSAGVWGLIGAAEALRDVLSDHGRSVIQLHRRVVRPDEVFQDSGYSDRDQFEADRDGSARLLSHLAESRLDGVVFARGLAADADAAGLSLELLDLVKLIASLDLDAPPPLRIVTRGAQFVGRQDPDALDGVHQAALWGLGNTITAEHPDLDCVRMDLDANPDSTVALVRDLLGACDENQIVYRAGKRYSPRLHDYAQREANANRIQPPSGPYEVRLKEFGTFDKFVAKEAIPDIVGDHDVHVEMQSVALNFKETLYVLGFLNPNQRDAIDIDFGMEGAGKIKKVGSKVTHLKPGDDVIIWHNGCLRSDFIVNVDRVIKMPATLSYAEAACIPTVFMTAYYALYHLAKIKKGDRVLIHACAGGVGQVALQIAQAVGAEVFATASEGKWSHLRAQGVEHVMNSRTLDFADQILAATGGEGVDIVFNSLAGDFIPKSFDALGKNGRFVEIGKKEIWTTERARDYRPDVDYQFFEIGEDVVSGGIGDESVINELMTQILADFAAGRLAPLPMKHFALRDVSAAFRYLSAGKNIGKVVVDLQEDRSATGIGALVRDDRTYIVTGGLGALGFLSANWLVKKGARHLALTGRSAPSGPVGSKLDELRTAGVDAVVIQGDVAVEADVARMMDRIDREMAPLGGILHCAGVLEDGVLAHLTEDRFRKCLLPKVDGSWNLHRATQDRKIDFFVLFSSVSAIMDGGGQGNYAAANAFMDRLASWRRSSGLPGLSVNWGGWADVGMAAQLLEKKGAVSDSLLSREEAFQALERVMVDDRVQATVCKLGDRLSGATVPRLLVDLAKQSSANLDEMTELEKVFHQHPGHSVDKNMEIFVSNQVAKVLGIDSPEGLDFDAELVELGVDSLSMTELRNAVQQGSGRTIKMATFFAHSSINRLAAHLAREFGEELAAGASGEAAKAEVGNADARSVEFISLADSAARNIFCFPGLNGNAFDFAEFADSNKDKYSVHVGQFVSEIGSPETDIRVIAADAIAEMRELQPEGPYCLVGYSYGGVVAIEAAHQLIESGCEVGFLIMIDTFPHFQYATDPKFRSYMSALIADSILAPMSLSEDQYDLYSKQIVESSMDELDAFFAGANADASGYSRVNLDLLRGIVEDGDKRTQAHYQPPARLNGIDIHFVRAGSQPRAVDIVDLGGFLQTPDMEDDLYGWGKYVANRFRLTRFGGHHNSLLKTEHVADLTQMVDALAGERAAAREAVEEI